MVGVGTAEGLVLRTTGTLVAHEVRIGTTDTRRACGLMGVHHDMVLRGLLHDVEIVIVHRL